MDLNNLIQNLQILLTFVTAILTLVVICGPLNRRPILERSFLFTLAISLIGASLNRLAKLWIAYDYDGSVLLLSSLIVMTTRVVAIAIGALLVGTWAMNCRAKKLAAEKRTLDSSGFTVKV